MRLVLLFSFALAGCLGDSPAQNNGLGGTMGQTDGGVGVGVGGGGDASAATDLAMVSSQPDLSPQVDLFPADIAGLTNCYGVALCDPTVHFCIRFFGGSQTAQGALAGGPACYQPSDTCANQGQQMDCGCIQADPSLGVNCQGSCVDNMNGSYDCYRNP